MKKMSSVCDYFVIASGSSTTQVRAVADHIAAILEEKEARVRHIEGMREASWVLLDCGNVVAHIFLEETRIFYGLEKLWDRTPQRRISKKITKKNKKKKKNRCIMAGSKKR